METSTSQFNKSNILRVLPYFLLGITLLFLFLGRCNNDVESVTTEIVTDTIYLEKIKVIPKIEEELETIKPRPVDIQVVNKDTIRSYSRVYKDSTGVAEITVEDSVNGILLNQKVKINVKEREIKYLEKLVTNTVTNTTKVKPYMVLSAGLTATSGVRPTIGAEVSLKNKNGYNLDFGYNNQKEFTIGLKKDLLTIYNKNK